MLDSGALQLTVRSAVQCWTMTTTAVVDLALIICGFIMKYIICDDVDDHDKRRRTQGRDQRSSWVLLTLQSAVQ